MTIPTPPRLRGDANEDLPAVIEWAWGLYRELALTSSAERTRLDRIAALPPLDTGTATLADVAATLNDIIAAATKD